MVKLKEIAKACKSKNAGPFELTIDIMFDSLAMFEKVHATGCINPSLIATLYGVRVEDVLFTVYPPALAYKATIPRRIPSGAVGDTDVYGAQQHALLLDLEIPI
jgi:hypothetical protein